MPVSAKTFHRLCALVLCTYAVTLVIGLYMPLQTDEVAYFLLNKRAWMEGKTLITLAPQCGKSYFAIPLPWLWYLPALFNSFTYDLIDNPLWIRLCGIIQFVVWLGLWIAVSVRLFAIPREKWWIALAVILAFLGLDAMPLALVVNRPEQILLITAGLFTASALYAEALGSRPFMRILCTLLLLFAALYSGATHVKAFFLLPLELVMGGVFLQRAWRSRVMTAAGVAILFYISLQSTFIDVARMQCPGSEAIQNVYSTAYLSPGMLFSSPFLFIIGAVLNLCTSIFSGLDLHYHITLKSAWIPLSLRPDNMVITPLTDAMDGAAWLLHAGFLALAAMVFYRQTLHTWRRWRAGVPISPSLTTVPLTILGILLLIMAAFFALITPLFYAPSFMLPLLLLATLFALRLNYGEAFAERPAFLKFAALLLLFAICNQALLFYRYEPFITEPQAHNSSISRRIMTTSAWGYDDKLPTLKSLAAKCGISTKTANHAVIDDTTYFLLHTTHEPLHLAYSIWLEDEFHPQHYFKLLKDYNSDGVIAACGNFPSKLLPYARQEGEFCCIPKTTIEKEGMR